jgi:predicted ArsR family transcriptional regulator
MKKKEQLSLRRKIIRLCNSYGSPYSAIEIAHILKLPKRTASNMMSWLWIYGYLSKPGFHENRFKATLKGLLL